MTTKQHCKLTLRVEATVIDANLQTEHHRIKFDFADLGERWAFIERLNDCLAQGYVVALQRIDPKVERLVRRYPVHG